LKIGIVTGDDILDHIDDLIARGLELRNMDTDEPLSTVPRSHSERECLSGRGADR